MAKLLDDFQAQYPEIWNAYTELRTICDKQGPLDPKTVQLIKIGISVAMEHEGGVIAHVSQAKDAGANDEEIQHAIVLATGLAGLPATLKGFGAVKKA